MYRRTTTPTEAAATAAAAASLQQQQRSLPNFVEKPTNKRRLIKTLTTSGFSI
jgi:hypothetical protein